MIKTNQFMDISICSCHRTFFNLFNCCAMLVIILIECSLLQPVVSGINHNEFLAQLKVPQCRQDCLEKFSSDDMACLQKLDCSICDFPPYQFHSFPDAINLMCWNSCAPRSSSASVIQPNPVDSVATKTDASEMIELSVRSMIHDGSLTMADIVWYADDPDQHQCLVTWEVFGGGIMGNLLTDTHEAELSLWPDSKYHIQVTCKNKNTNKMSKSLPILIDTANAQKKTTTTMKTHRPEASASSSSSQIDGNDNEHDENVIKKNTETERPPFSQPHSNHAQDDIINGKITTATITATQMTTIRIQSTPSESSDNNHLSYDATKTIAGYANENYLKYKQQQQQHHHEYNNHRQITAKPLYNAQKMSSHDETIENHEQNGKANDANLMHGITATSPSRDAAKLTKSSTMQHPTFTANTKSAAKTTQIRHSDIETSLSVLCVVMVVVCLVICTIVLVRHRRKSNKHCDKSNLISGSVSCSSTTSINDCEMDFNSSTVCITQTTAIHV